MGTTVLDVGFAAEALKMIDLIVQEGLECSFHSYHGVTMKFLFPVIPALSVVGQISGANESREDERRKNERKRKLDRGRSLVKKKKRGHDGKKSEG